jgi:TolA-binding protein
MSHRARMALLALLPLAACSTAPTDPSPRIKDLQTRSVSVAPNADIPSSRDKAIAGYREFLGRPDGGLLQSEAMRRLGDLQMERGDEKQVEVEPAVTSKKGARAKSSTSADEYRTAIKHYQDYLRAYPHRPGNDRVLYQLARAYEQLGDLDTSLATLTRLITEYPNTPNKDEVQFRRGEFYFAKRAYPEAEQAYHAVVTMGDGSQYFENAIYMHGWSLFKQEKYDAGLDSFFAILDRKLPKHEAGGPALVDTSTLSRGNREMVDDTFRVMSISFASMEGAQAVARTFARVGPKDYEYLVYQNLGDLYIKQERIKDAADSYGAFTERYPNHPQAPLMQVKVIDAYKQAGFADLVLAAKKDFVVRYGAKSTFRQAQDATSYQAVVPYLKQNLDDLARHYHASAQKTKSPADYHEATRWYQAYLESFPNDPQAPAMNFLLAEALFESKQYNDAAIEYERTAYHYPAHPKSADAGYAALQAYEQYAKQLQGEELRKWQQNATFSALRFADTYPQDPRTPAVLTAAAEKFYAQHSPDKAAELARRVLALKPEATPEQRRTVWTVIAHTDFEKGAFDRAETDYQQVLALTASNDPLRPALVERLAASVYKEGEQKRATGDSRGAVDAFLRVGTVAPASAIRITAEYDAAATLVGMKDWPGAIKILEGFRKNYPGNALQPEVTTKLAAAYLETGQLPKAAAEFETLAGSMTDPQARRGARWQIAELYEKAGRTPEAASAYSRYIKEYPSPLEPAIEARQKLADMYKAGGQAKEQSYWLQDIVNADRQGGRERTDRTRYLAARASIHLAEPAFDAYKSVKLVEPLKKNLKVKKERMEAALKAYTAAADYGVADITTESTFRIAEIYNDFGRALMTSQRPKGLSAVELEQYNVLLEEQAFPFEEKAIEVHEVNAQRTANGIYDSWVKNSFAELTKLRPVRYGKLEKSEGAIDAIR